MRSRQADTPVTYDQMLAALRRKREEIEEAILLIERLKREEGSQPGRLPAWLQKARNAAKNAPSAKQARARKARKQS